MLKPNLPLYVGKTETSKTSVVLNIEIVYGIKKNVHQIRIGGEPRAARSW